MDPKEEKLRKEVKENISKIFSLRKKNKKFIPGKTWIQYAGAVFDDNEINASIESLVNGWFGLGKQAEKLEKGLKEFVGSKGAVLTNSGSSANLLAIASLMSPFFPDHLNPGDEVITAACGFPTTVNPLIFYGLVPVFLDVNSQTYNLNPEDLEKALSKKTRAVMVAHTLGNPNRMDKIKQFCKKNKLLLIEDNCDSLGSTYKGQKTGSFGILATQSFYPPHHITMGEGGALLYNDFRFDRITRSLRDWGRSCWCRGDEKRTHGSCQVRFKHQLDGKPYDHKYLQLKIGFNLKPIEPQAAMGVEQLKRINSFVKKRKENFQRLDGYAKQWGKYFILPKATPGSDPCWFAYPLTIKTNSPFTRHDITTFLEERMIQTRPLFAGNITRQPAYKSIKYRKIGKLENADHILFHTFFVGIYPGLTKKEIDYIAENINTFLKRYR
ncbi:MAG: lipopolysaccharide biosynthesis protein RfbH [Actinobacteria bacterium]|nr:lipopolysaccharide biosynthesis protein RfbH [Actinomycetota bacterium]